ncbi:MAG TPA: AbrB/MazE/SpoVT family DNA-binding domain-containing protein [Candidatus Nanoarchaeia archaeon]|nr:AbrB/MazE/SpoVT family DNA-binding domain-containing protein [Candidatus Nanoarchaeia archaeon]
MADIVTVGEKGQIVIPKRFREDLRIKKGTRLLVSEDKDKLTIKPVTLDEKHLFLLLSEPSLKKVWGNTYDWQWDDVL